MSWLGFWTVGARQWSEKNFFHSLILLLLLSFVIQRWCYVFWYSPYWLWSYQHFGYRQVMMLSFAIDISRFWLRCCIASFGGALKFGKTVTRVVDQRNAKNSISEKKRRFEMIAFNNNMELCGDCIETDSTAKCSCGPNCECTNCSCGPTCPCKQQCKCTPTIKCVLHR